MSRTQQIPPKVLNLIKSFKTALKKYFGNFERKRSFKEYDSANYYEQAKRAETQQRNLFKALQLYIKAIENGQKKDSSIKDFASSLHQLGFTKQAVRLMDDCEIYYDGNKDKYFRLRDNLEIQIRPTGKHLCRYLLIQNINDEIKQLQTQEEIKNCLFKSPKRIKKLFFLEDFELVGFDGSCTKENSNNILVEFQSFSAAKKTLESFYFDEWFGSNLYWVNSDTMRIVCAAIDGKKDFEEGFIVNDDLIREHLYCQKESFWTTFGQKVYVSKNTNGFINLLSTNLIKEYLSELDQMGENKENIFESSKINQPSGKEKKTYVTSLQQLNDVNDVRSSSWHQEIYERDWERKNYYSYKSYEY